MEAASSWSITASYIAPVLRRHTTPARYPGFGIAAAPLLSRLFDTAGRITETMAAFVGEYVREVFFVVSRCRCGGPLVAALEVKMPPPSQRECGLAAGHHCLLNISSPPSSLLQ